MWHLSSVLEAIEYEIITSCAINCSQCAVAERNDTTASFWIIEACV